MFSFMIAQATLFDTNAAEGSLRPIIRYKPDGQGKKEIVNARWGTNPRFSGGVEYRFVRSEGRTFPSHRCLVPASEFHMQVGKTSYRVSRDDGNFFYLAGIWEPPMAGYPLAFRIITVAANVDVAEYQERHGAMIERSQVMKWLDGTVPEADLLVTPSARTFLIQEIGAVSGKRKPVQTPLTLDAS